MKKFFFLTVLGFFLTVFLANSFAGEANQFVKVENKGIMKTAQRSYILSDDGTVLARLFMENREDVPLKNVPPIVQQAFIAIEDERYYKHHGIDYFGITRAFVANIKSGHVVEGGSTITQQYVKNSIGNKDQTVTRKIREAVLAAQLEGKYTKTQILEAYLNTIYFGHGAYGIEAAAEVFFGKKAHELTLAEGALLAGCTKSPLNFSPYFNPDRSFKRKDTVLNRMAKLGFITEKEAEAARKEVIKLVPLKEEQVIAPYFVEYVKKLLIDEYGVDKVFKGGLRVHTTLNIRAQKAAEQSIASELNLKKDPEAALVSINPKNGHIISLVGGRDFKNIKYNLATQGKRQPGSSFKTFVLITALKQGIKPDDTFNSTSPQVIKISDSPHIKPWIVHNCEGRGYGMMKLREATVHSVNAVYANVTMKVGADKIVETAKQMGIKTPLDPYPSIGIGGLTVGVSPLEMASAYGTIANGGVHVEPTPIVKITDPKGKTIKNVVPLGKQVIDKNIAYIAADIMQGTVQRGTATRANIGRPAAGKTGTNQLYRDAWFVGYTPDLVTAVWMGHPEAQVSMYNVHGSRGFGGIIPATIWRKFMKQALKDTPISYFPKPGQNKTPAKKNKRSSSSGNNSTYSRNSNSRSTGNRSSYSGPPSSNSSDSSLSRQQNNSNKSRPSTSNRITNGSQDSRTRNNNTQNTPPITSSGSLSGRSRTPSYTPSTQQPTTTQQVPQGGVDQQNSEHTGQSGNTPTTSQNSPTDNSNANDQ